MQIGISRYLLTRIGTSTKKVFHPPGSTLPLSTALLLDLPFRRGFHASTVLRNAAAAGNGELVVDDFEPDEAVPASASSFEDDDDRRGPRVRLGAGGKTSMEQQRFIKAEKMKLQEKRLQDRKKRDPLPILIPHVCTPRTLSSILQIRAIDILKYMIKVGLDPKTTHEIIESQIVDLICQDQWYTPVRQTLDAGSTIPSKYAAYLEALESPSFHEEKKQWLAKPEAERAKLTEAAERAQRKKMNACTGWKKASHAILVETNPSNASNQRVNQSNDDNDDDDDDENDDDDDDDEIDDEIEEEDELLEKNVASPSASGESSSSSSNRAFDIALLRPRPPIVTVLGHVNHGKTTLLDRLHGSSQVVKEESGGITQHVRVFQTECDGHQITFLDTPGHAAFSGIRKRGADVTDIVLLIVAVDAGVKPQTIESARFALERELPIIVVLNKCDRSLSAEDISGIGSQLADIGVHIDEMGGSIPSVKISALTGKGLEDLQDLILMQAYDLQLEAEAVALAEGIVIESLPTTKGLGIEVTCLIQWGTLNIGDALIVGGVAGKVKLLFDASTGKPLRSAAPSQPVRVVGLKESPRPGDTLQVLPDEKAAKAVALAREKYQKKQQYHEDQKSLVENMKLLYSGAAAGGGGGGAAGGLGARVASHDIDPEARGAATTQSGVTGVVLRSGEASVIETELVIVVKTDVYSSFEAIQAAVKEQMGGDDQLSIRFIHSGPGTASEMDVEIAAAAGTAIICFRTDATPRAQKEAEGRKVPIHRFSVIYDATTEIRTLAEAKLLPHIDAQIAGDLQVLKPFAISIKGTSVPVAGGRVVKGEISRSHILRLTRAGKVLAEGPIQSLKFFKEDIATVKKGSECGVRIEGWDDYQPGDLLQAIKYIKTPRRLGEMRRNDYQLIIEDFTEQSAKLAEQELVQQQQQQQQNQTVFQSQASFSHSHNNNYSKSNRNNQKRK